MSVLSSATAVAGHDSEVYIVPQRIYKDPFRGGENIIVLCDCYEPPRQLDDGSLSELKVLCSPCTAPLPTSHLVWVLTTCLRMNWNSSK